MQSINWTATPSLDPPIAISESIVACACRILYSIHKLATLPVLVLSEGKQSSSNINTNQICKHSSHCKLQSSSSNTSFQHMSRWHSERTEFTRRTIGRLAVASLLHGPHNRRNSHQHCCVHNLQKRAAIAPHARQQEILQTDPALNGSSRPLRDHVRRQVVVNIAFAPNAFFIEVLEAKAASANCWDVRHRRCTLLPKDPVE